MIYRTRAVRAEETAHHWKVQASDNAQRTAINRHANTLDTLDQLGQALDERDDLRARFAALLTEIEAMPRFAPDKMYGLQGTDVPPFMVGSHNGDHIARSAVLSAISRARGAEYAEHDDANDTSRDEHEPLHLRPDE